MDGARRAEGSMRWLAKCKYMASYCQGINWKYQKTHPYNGAAGRLGALASWYNNSGIIAAGRQESRDEGIAALETAVMLWPENASWYESLAMGYLRAGRFDDAVESAKQAVALGKTHAPFHFTLAFARAM